VGFRGRRMERVRVVRSFDGTGGGDSSDYTSRASRAPGSGALIDTGWRNRRGPGSSLGCAEGRDTASEQLE
jgi:hypothetical protein